MIKSILKFVPTWACLLLILGIGELVSPMPILIAGAEAASPNAYRHRHGNRARRTTRRVIRSTHVYVNHLPAGCTTVVIEDTRLHHCGQTYYRLDGNRYVVVVIE
jgi:hypothetical protein